MNRAQKRAIVNTNQKLYTEPEVRAMIRKTQERTLHKLADDYSAVMMYTLRNKLKFGHTRAKRFIQDVTETFADIDAGLITIDDLKQTLEDEIGVIIQ